MATKLAWMPVEEREKDSDTGKRREMPHTLLSIARSWRCADSAVNPTVELFDWVERRKAETAVEIRKISLEECAPWFYDAAEGCIRE